MERGAKKLTKIQYTNGRADDVETVIQTERNKNIGEFVYSYDCTRGDTSVSMVVSTCNGIKANVKQQKQMANECRQIAKKMNSAERLKRVLEERQAKKGQSI